LPKTWNVSVSEIIVLTTLYLFILTLEKNTFISILSSEDLKEAGNQFSLSVYFHLHRSFRIICKRPGIQKHPRELATRNI